MIFPNSGLYAITQTKGKPDTVIVNEVTAAIQGGASVIQYRNKNPRNAEQLAKALLSVCQTYNIPLIINDNIELAYRIGADGVHIGQHDKTIEIARKRLGKQAIIGISCYNSVEKAIRAVENSADYVAFGRFFPSTSKPLASAADLSTLTQAKATLHVPIVAIGGILPENGTSLLQAGADVLAVIGGLFDRHPQQSATAYQQLFKR